MFVNRKPELEHLERLYRSDRTELFIEERGSTWPV